MYRFVFILLSLYGFPLVCNAQIVDPGFRSPVPEKAPVILDMAMQADGKVVVAGQIDFVGDHQVYGIMRLNADGTLDESFSYYYMPSALTRHVAIQSNGDIVFADRNLVGVLSQSGVLKSSVILSSAVTDICLQPDGRILVAFGSKVQRYSGTLVADNAFNAAVTLNNSVYSVALQGTKIVISGNFTIVNTTSKNYMARLNSDGTIDPTFTAGVAWPVSSLVVQPDGKIIMDGTPSSSASSRFLNRLNADGSIDAGFTPPDVTPGNRVAQEVTVMSTYSTELWNGKIYIAALVDLGGYQQKYLMRLNDDGTIDYNFWPIGLHPAVATTFAITPTNSIIASGTHHPGWGWYQTFTINQYTSEGYSDALFNPQEVTAFGSINAIDHKNGAYIVSGEFIRLNGYATSGVARLNSDGSINPTFTYQSFAKDIQAKILNDENILVYGDSTYKIDMNGYRVEDFYFQPFKNLDNVKQAVELPDGKIMVADKDGHIYRLHADGSEDTGFNVGTGASGGTVYGLNVLGTRVYLSGTFTSFNGKPANRLICLDANGAPDPGFNIGTGAANFSINSIEPLQNGELLIFGSFTQFNGVNTPQKIAKLSAGGEISATFQNNLPAVSYIGATNAKRRKNKILMWGIPSVAPPFPVSSVNYDGTVDPNFTPPNEIESLGSVFKVAAFDNNTMFLMGKIKIASETESVFMVKLLDNEAPHVRGTSFTTMSEDVPRPVSLNDFTIEDNDTDPSGLTISLENGEHYSVDGNILIPEPDYSGNINVSVNISDGTSATSYSFDVFVAPVNDRPEIISVIEGLKITTNAPLQISLTDITVNDPDDIYPAGFSFTLIDGEHYSVTANSIVADRRFNGTINVKVTVNDSEADSKPFIFPVLVDIVTDIEEERSSVELGIYPNPVQDIVKLQYAGPEPVRNIYIINVSGQQVFHQESIDGNVWSADVSALPKGLYLVRISTTKNVVTRKILKL